MLLPLHSLLGISTFEHVALVVDNARSPADPVSFRRKKNKPRPAFARSFSCSDTDKGNRWLSHPSQIPNALLTSPVGSPDRTMRPPERTKSPRKGFLVTPSKRTLWMNSPLTGLTSFPKLPVRRLSPDLPSPRTMLRKTQSLRVMQCLALLEEEAAAAV